MASSPAAFAERPLLVVALGGNALSPPSGDVSYAVERDIVAATAQRLKSLADASYRLLVVHGNGPQVGRLMRDDVAGVELDVYVAQTQGELGYLIVEALRRAGVPGCVSLVTRALVAPDDPGLEVATKAVGPVLDAEPRGRPSRAVGNGWRLLVGSPRPRDVLELAALRALLGDHHVVAGGGGGIPVTEDGPPVAGVIDKDWIAALLAIALDAQALVFATDVDGVFGRFGGENQHLIPRLDATEAERMLNGNALGAGSMAPKVESAAQYARATGRGARIVGLEHLAMALRGATGTTVTPLDGH